MISRQDKPLTVSQQLASFLTVLIWKRVNSAGKPRSKHGVSASPALVPVPGSPHGCSGGLLSSRQIFPRRKATRMPEEVLDKIDWVPGSSLDLNTGWVAAWPCASYLVFWASVSSSVKWAYPTQEDCCENLVNRCEHCARKESEPKDRDLLPGGVQHKNKVHLLKMAKWRVEKYGSLDN